MPKRRKKLALAEPREIVMAIYSLTTRGKRARSHIKEELTQIIAAAKHQLEDYRKGLESRRRHKYRNPAWPSTQRSNEWFRTHRREAINEPGAWKAAEQQEEHEWKSLDEYKAYLAQPAPAAFAQPSTAPAKSQAQLDYERNLAVSREIGKERGEQGWDD